MSAEFNKEKWFKELAKKLSDNNEDWKSYFENKSDEAINTTIELYLKDIKSQIEDIEDCTNCKSYDKCPKIIKGFQTKMINSNFEMKFYLHECDKYKEHQKIINRNKSFKINHCNSKPLSFNLEAVEKRLKLYVNIEKEKNIKQFLNHLKWCVKSDVQNIKPIYIYSNDPAFKTESIMAFCNEFYLNHEKCTLSHVKVNQLMNDIKDGWNNTNGDGTNYFDILKNVDILILDDLGRTEFKSWYHTQFLYVLIESRFQNNLPTFFLSNKSLADLEKFYIESSGNSTASKSLITDFIKKIRNCIQIADSENKANKYRELGI